MHHAVVGAMDEAVRDPQYHENFVHRATLGRDGVGLACALTAQPLATVFRPYAFASRGQLRATFE